MKKILILTLLFGVLAGYIYAESQGAFGSTKKYLKRVGTNIVPAATNTYNIGSTSKKFGEIHVTTSNVTGVIADKITVTTFTVTGNGIGAVSLPDQSVAGADIVNNSITDAQLEYNTGQHLTSTSNPTFASITASSLTFTANVTLNCTAQHSLTCDTAENTTGIASGNYYNEVKVSSSIYSDNSGNAGTVDTYHLNQNVLITSTPTFGGVLINGNVGIGTENPSYPLDVLNTVRVSSNVYVSGRLGFNTVNPKARIDLGVPGSPAALFYSNGNIHTGIFYDIPVTNDFTLCTHNSGNLVFGKTAANVVPSVASELCRFTSAGNCGIGTTNPGYGLHVVNQYGVYMATSPNAGNIVIQAQTGNVGIGLTNPAAKLDVKGTLSISGTDNIILNSNYLSGDNGDEGISIDSNGMATFTGDSGNIYVSENSINSSNLFIANSAVGARTNPVCYIDNTQLNNAGEPITFNYDTLFLRRNDNDTDNTTSQTLTNTGSVLYIDSTYTDTGSHIFSSNVLGIEMDMDTKYTTDVYAIQVVNDNDGDGNPGGIDFSAFSSNEPLLKFPNGYLYDQLGVSISSSNVSANPAIFVAPTSNNVGIGTAVTATSILVVAGTVTAQGFVQSCTIPNGIDYLEAINGIKALEGSVPGMNAPLDHDSLPNGILVKKDYQVKKYKNKINGDILDKMPRINVEIVKYQLDNKDIVDSLPDGATSYTVVNEITEIDDELTYDTIMVDETFKGQDLGATINLCVKGIQSLQDFIGTQNIVIEDLKSRIEKLEK